MTRAPSHRRLFVILVAVILALSLASLLSGVLAGGRIQSVAGSGWLDRQMNPVSDGIALLMCLGALICLTAGVSVGFMGMTNASMKAKANGTIRRSMIRSFPCDGTTEHYIFSVVAFEVEGIAYETEGMHRFSSNIENVVKERLAGIRPGDPVQVFFNPGDPDVIDLDNPPKDRWGSIFFGMVLVVLGLILLFNAGSSFRA